MSSTERIEISKDEFRDLYLLYHGFNDQFNKNHPLHKRDESILSFIKKGGESLLEEEPELVNDIITRG